MNTHFSPSVAAPLSRRKWLAATAGLFLSLTTLSAAKAADDTIKVGVLHSLSGTMAISETTLKDTILFLIDEQNKKGGVLGKKLEAVVVDPASNWPLFAEKARGRSQPLSAAERRNCSGIEMRCHAMSSP
jgi:urea transport system substrate-binding protein